MKHTKKRVAALLLTLAMVLSLMPAAFAADTDFPDMPAEDEASYAAVKSAVDNEIMTGENGMLNLDGHILRSTVSKMVVTAFAAKGEADLSDYPDVADGAWYAEWMAKANQMGIMSGTSGKMRPSDEVTLQEVATMLVRALGLEPGTEADLENVPGAEDVAAWAIPWVAALVKAGYISDVTGANQPMTRGAFAEVIYKVSGEGNYVKEAGEITEDVDGNIVITAGGVSLKGITVKGDVIIADGVDAGSINLDGVTIEGRLVVRGGAEASLTNGTTASATVVAKTSGEVTVKADDSSKTGAIDVAGTNSKTAEKVTLDMAEPNVTVNTETAVALQNAKGGEVTVMAGNASVAVESGTVGNIVVANGVTDVKVDVAEGATIEKITTNENLTVTGEGTVSEVTGSGVVSDESGEVIGGGDDEPANVPTVSDVSNPADPNAPTNVTHEHNWGTTATPFDATRHTFTCVNRDADTANGIAAVIGCGASRYENHNYNIACKPDGEVSGTAAENTTAKCVCGRVKPADPTTTVDKSDIDPETAKECGTEGAEATSHTFEREVTQELSCTQAGIVVETCTTCGYKKTTTTPATGHNLVVKSTVAATCNAPGKTIFKCSNTDCTYGNDNSVYTVISATGNHTWKLDSDTPVTPATCAATGSYNYKCTSCTVGNVGGQDYVAATTTTPIAKDPNAHSYNITNNGDGTHTLACANKATCHAEDKTVQCSMIAKADGTAAKAPTCNTAGATGDKICSVEGCGYEIASEEIAATGKHTFKSTWAYDASGHWHECETCTGEKAKTTSAEHTWSKTVDGKPADGAVCTVCGHQNGGSGSGTTEPEVKHEADKTTWLKDETNHWHGCAVANCDQNHKYDSVAHTYAEDAAQGDKCTVCGGGSAPAPTGP